MEIVIFGKMMIHRIIKFLEWFLWWIYPTYHKDLTTDNATLFIAMERAKERRLKEAERNG